MQLISPYHLENEHIYYIESFGPDGRINKYRGTIMKCTKCTWLGNIVIRIENIIEYINGKESVFQGIALYVPINTKPADEYCWLFYKPVAEYLMIIQVIRQRTHLDNETICGLYKQHIGVI